MSERTSRSCCVWAFVVAAAGFPMAAQAPVQHAGQYEQADIEHGLRLYGEHCSGCHATTGDGVAGVNLQSGQFRRVRSDDELRLLIVNGIPGTAMPPHKLAEPELVGLVAYVRNMRDFDSRAVALGDIGRGLALFTGKGACTSCHSVRGNGARLAPDLGDIGAIRSAGTLQRSLLDPTGTMLPHNRSVRATTRDGRVISGRRLNEDTYTVQLIDQNQRLVSLDKADLREYSVLQTSPMPSYKDKLSSQELADVLAYLVSLKGLR